MVGAESETPDGLALVSVLGPCSLVVQGQTESVALSVIQRRILSRLALGRPGPVDVHQMSQAVWGEEPPPTARAALHNQVSRIRALAGSEIVVTTTGGYRLHALVDAESLHDQLMEAERLLESGEPALAFDIVDRWISNWAGDSYTDLADHVDFNGARDLLRACHYACETLRLVAGVELGRFSWAVPEAQRLVAATPHDEYRASLLAQALQRSGRRGEALGVLSATRRALRQEFGLEPGPELAAAEHLILNSKVEVDDDPANRKFGEITVPYVGHRAEVSSLVEKMLNGGLQYLHGARGTGVTRFLAEARRGLLRRGANVVLVQCPEHPDTAVAILNEVLDELGISVDATLTGFIEAIRKAALTRTTVILVDDAQHVGPTSRALLADAAELPGVAVTLASHRLSDQTEFADAMILEDLSPHETEILVAAMLRHCGAEQELDAEMYSRIIDDIVEASGGNPLLAETMVSGLAEQRSDAQRFTTEMLFAALAEAPAAPLVRSWYEKLPDAERSLLELVAVAGGQVAPEFLDALTSARPAVPDHLFIVDDKAGLRFRHRVVRDVVYNDVSTGRREDLHHFVGTVAATQRLPRAFIAHHLLLAARLDPTTAMEAACLAAEDATVLGAHRDAMQWLSRARQVAAMGDDVHRKLAIDIALGDAMRLAGDPEHLEHLLSCASRAVELDDVSLTAEAAFALLQLGGSSDFGGLDPRIIHITEHTLGHIGGTDDAALVSAAASLAWSMTGQAARSREFFTDAERISKTDSTRRRVLPFAYLALGMPHDLPERTAIARELIELAEKAQDPVAMFEGLQLDFSVRLMTGDGDAARNALTRMTDLTDRVGDVGRRWSLLYLAAAMAHLDGRDQDCEQLATQAWQLFDPISPSRAVAAFQAQLLPLRMTQNRLVELVDPLAELVNSLPGIPAWHAAYALCLTCEPTQESIAEARRQLRHALNRTQEDFTWLAAHVIGGRAAAVAGDDAIRGEYLARLEPWSGLACWQGTCSYGPVDTALSLLARSLGDHQAAKAYAITASNVCDSLGAVPYARELSQLMLL